MQASGGLARQAWSAIATLLRTDLATSFEAAAGRQGVSPTPASSLVLADHGGWSWSPGRPGRGGRPCSGWAGRAVNLRVRL